jgi:hypothetical protein
MVSAAVDAIRDLFASEGAADYLPAPAAATT